MKALIKQFHATLERAELTIKQFCELYWLDYSMVVNQLFNCVLSKRVEVCVRAFIRRVV